MTERALWRWTLLALAILVSPVLLFPRPPVIDFPNHATRIWLLSGGANHPALHPIYVPDWTRTVMNIGVDVVGVILAPILTGWGAARFDLALAVLAPAVGCIALNARICGRLTWWSAALSFFGWSTTLLMGFLNFQIALGLALLAAAADARFTTWRAPRAHLARALCGVGLVLFHPFAVPLYAGLLIALRLGQETRTWRSLAPWREGILAAVVALAPLLLLMLLSPRLPSANFINGSLAEMFHYTFGPFTVAMLVSPVLTYRVAANAVDIGLAVLLLALPAFLLLTRRAQLHAGLSALAIALFLFSLFIPDIFYQSWLTGRAAQMAWLVGAASFMPMAAERRPWLRAGCAAALALVAVRSAWVGANWAAAQEDVRSVDRALANVRPAQRVLVLMRMPTDDAVDTAPMGRYVLRRSAAFWHDGAFAVVDHDAFVPTLFAARGQQPLRVAPPYDEIANPLGCAGLPAQTLQDAQLLLQTEAMCPAYIHLWRSRFDYVLVLNADESDAGDWDGAFHPPAGLSVEHDAGFARLYRVSRSRDIGAPNTK